MLRGSDLAENLERVVPAKLDFGDCPRTHLIDHHFSRVEVAEGLTLHVYGKPTLVGFPMVQAREKGLSGGEF